MAVAHQNRERRAIGNHLAHFGLLFRGHKAAYPRPQHFRGKALVQLKGHDIIGGFQLFQHLALHIHHHGGKAFIINAVGGLLRVGLQII